MQENIFEHAHIGLNQFTQILVVDWVFDELRIPNLPIAFVVRHAVSQSLVGVSLPVL